MTPAPVKRPARSAQKPRGHGAERREEILAAALKLLGRFGVHGVTTRMIAQAVGISQPSLYAHFPSKDAIAAELHARAFLDLEARLSAGMVEVDTPEDLARALRIYIDFGLENPDAYRVAFMIEGPMASPPDLSNSGRTCFGLLRQCVRDLHQRGLARDDDPERLAQSLWAGLHGLTSLLIARPAFPWAPLEHLIKGHLELLTRAAMR